MRSPVPAIPLCTITLLALAACTPEPGSSAQKKDGSTHAKADDTKTEAEDAKPEDAKPEDAAEAKPEATEAASKVATSKWESLVSPAPALSKAPAGSVLAEVRAFDKPVALIMSDAGLELFSPQGMDRTLVSGAVDNAMYDPRSGIVLLIQGSSLAAIDLAAPLEPGEAPPVAQLSNAATTAELLLVYPDRHAVVSQSDPGSEYLRIDWSASPSLALQAPMYPPEDESPPQTLALSDPAWLSSRVDRHAWPVPKPPAAALEYPHMPEGGAALNPLFADRCFDYQCGAALPLGTGGYELVVVGDGMGDFMHVMSIVHDPATDRWISFDAWTSGGAWITAKELPSMLEQLDAQGDEHHPRFDASGEMFAPYTRDKRLCSARGKCTAVAGEVVDFLAGGVELGAVYFGAP